MLIDEDGLIHHNSKVCNTYEDDNKEFQTDSENFNQKLNDEKVDYQNAAYLKDRGIYPISFLFVENAGKKIFLVLQHVRQKHCIYISNVVYLSPYYFL